MIRIFFLLVFSIALLLPSFPVTVFAQNAGEACSCFCESSAGAYELERVNDTKSCRAQCKAQEGSSILGCLTHKQANLRPENNSLCWTPSECEEEFHRRVSEDGLTGIAWEESVYWSQSPSCLPREGACYPPHGRFNLNQVIGGSSSVQGIGDYVNIIYNLLLVFASVVAIISIMIAGLMWMTARGNATQTGKARALIGKSLMSIVILLIIVAAAELIDPRLTKFNVLKTNLIQKVQYIPEGQSCEALIEKYDATITAKTSDESCGDVGIIEDLGTAAEGKTVGLTEGGECIYQFCGENSAESCVQVKGEWECIRCGNVVKAGTGGAALDLKPSASVCSQLTILPSIEERLAGNGILHMCRYYDAGWISWDSIVENDACVELTYPASDGAGINCKSLAEQGCKGYDDVSVFLRQTVGAQVASMLAGNTVDWYEGVNNDYPLWADICNNDVCNVSASGCLLDTRREIGDGLLVDLDDYSEYIPDSIETGLQENILGCRER